MRTDGANVLQAGNFVAFVIENIQQFAFLGGLALEGSLVGFIGKQNIANLNLVANLLQPLTDDAAFHSDASLGHQNTAGLGCAGSSRSSSGGSSFGSSGRSLSRSFRTGSALQGRSIFTGIANGADILQARNLVAFFEELLQQRTGCSGFALEGSLVGLISKQNVAYVDSIAHVDLPLTNDAGFYSDAGFGHQNTLCHS